MICAYDQDAGCWVAAGRGVMRPIVVEAATCGNAMAAFFNVAAEQDREEYAYQAAMERPIIEAQEGAPEDLG